MAEFEKKLDFDSDTFEDMKKDMNFVLQRLIGTMQEKQATEGSMTLKIDVSMIKEFIPNFDPEIKGETREVSKPQFKHKVTSNVKINDEKSGNLNSEMELFFDEESRVYAMRPITNTQQRTIFDSDFMGEEENNEDIIDGSAKLLPGPTEEESEEESEEEGEEDPLEGDMNPPEDAEDITDELLGDEEKKDDGEDDYNYEEPEG